MNNEKFKKPLFWLVLLIWLIFIFSITYFLLGFRHFSAGFGHSLVDRIVNSVYFSIVTITTLGYGDISPITIMSKIIVSIETLLGIFVAGGFLNALFQKMSKDQEIKQRKEEGENQFKRLFRFMNPRIKIYINALYDIDEEVKENGNISIEPICQLLKQQDRKIYYILQKRRDFLSGISSLQLTIDFQYLDGIEKLFVLHSQVADNSQTSDFESYFTAFYGYSANKQKTIINELTNNKVNKALSNDAKWIQHLHTCIVSDIDFIRQLRECYFGRELN